MKKETKKVVVRLREDEWEDDLPFEEVKNFNRIQNKISEMEKEKLGTIKTLFTKR